MASGGVLMMTGIGSRKLVELSWTKRCPPIGIGRNSSRGGSCSFSSSSSTHTNNRRASSSAAAAANDELFEEEEDSKFVPLNPDDPQYGPPALLLLGFDIEETAKIQELLKNLEGEFLKIIHCTEDMIGRSLWEAVHAQQPNLERAKIAKSLPRICFLSGLTGEEMIMFIDAFPETGLEAAVFAAVVPNSANKSLQELIDEVMGDHEMVTARESGSAA